LLENVNAGRGSVDRKLATGGATTASIAVSESARKQWEQRAVHYHGVAHFCSALGDKTGASGSCA
jgi:hypothetical protein